jgi:hypothetical protein
MPLNDAFLPGTANLCLFSAVVATQSAMLRAAGAMKQLAAATSSYPTKYTECPPQNVFAPSFLDRIIAAVSLCMQLPFNDYYDYYGPDFQLHIAPSNMENLNHDKCAFPRNFLKAVHTRIAGTCTLTSRRFSPTSGELSSPHRMPIVLTKSSAVSVYAPSGNTGGVEVHTQPKQPGIKACVRFCLCNNFPLSSMHCILFIFFDERAGHWHSRRPHVPRERRGQG